MSGLWASGGFNRPITSGVRCQMIRLFVVAVGPEVLAPGAASGRAIAAAIDFDFIALLGFRFDLIVLKNVLQIRLRNAA